jgi:hypothetical protein
MANSLRTFPSHLLDSFGSQISKPQILWIFEDHQLTSPGGGLLTRSARFNHSCLPNVQGTWADGCAEWRALRAIAPGEAKYGEMARRCH